jgi:hypothetical protein
VGNFGKEKRAVILKASSSVLYLKWNIVNVFLCESPCNICGSGTLYMNTVR